MKNYIIKDTKLFTSKQCFIKIKILLVAMNHFLILNYRIPEFRQRTKFYDSFARTIRLLCRVLVSYNFMMRISAVRYRVGQMSFHIGIRPLFELLRSRRKYVKSLITINFPCLVSVIEWLLIIPHSLEIYYKTKILHSWHIKIKLLFAPSRSENH